MRRSLNPPELRFVCGNRIVDVEWQLDYHESYKGPGKRDNRVLTFQDFVPFMPIYLCVKGEEWPGIFLCRGYETDINISFTCQSPCV